MSAEWQTSRLDDAADLLTGFPFRSAEYVDDQMQPRLLRGDNIIQGKLRWENSQHWPAAKTESVKEYALSDGDVVVAMDRPWIEAGLKFARITKHDLPCFLVQRVSRLRARQHVDQRFLSFLIASRDFTEHVLAVQTGTSVPHISAGQIKEFEFILPPLDEQRAIARVLGALDDKIELNRRMNRTLEELAAALFRSWFVDFDPVVAKAAGRQPAHLRPELAALFPAHWQDSPLGPIPHGWRVRPANEVIEFNPVRRLAKGAPAPYLDMQNMPTDSALPANWVIRPHGSGMKFQNGDTLMARITPCLENGKTAFVNALGDGEVGWGSTEYIVMRPLPPLPLEYGYYLARSDDFRAHATANMTGSSGRQRVAANCFEHFHVTKPPKEIAVAFGNVAAPFMRMMKANVEESRTLAALRDTLLPKLLSGELRVKQAEKLVEATA